jgi:hypothetical protein
MLLLAAQQAMQALYADMHRNVLDLFNEYGVQIMTPRMKVIPRSPRSCRRNRGSSRRLAGRALHDSLDDHGGDPRERRLG